MKRYHLLQVALALTFASTARAGTTDCATLANPVFIPGTTDIKPFLARVAPKLALAAGADQMTIVYLGIGSCTAADYVLAGTDLTGTGVYWTGAYNMDGTPVEASCTFVTGDKADLALSDVTVRTCTGADIPSGSGEFSSMVQAFGFVVPPTSSQTAITATEGYFLYKFGGEADYQVPPWTNPAFVFIRTPAASTQLLTGLAAGIPGTMWSANLTSSTMGSSGMIAAVAAENTTGNAEATIGILSAQRYDGVRDQVRMLAFESFGQECLGAVYPDSTPTAFDKQNVRDGHYSIWGYLWAISPVDGGGAPSGLAAAQFIDFLTGSTSINDADPIGDAARVGAIPACAMNVSRAFDGASLEPLAPSEPCGCFYEFTATGATGCESCTGTCTTGVCRFGYCEEN